MTYVGRESQLLDAFATLADTLVADYDPVDLLQTLVETCERLFDVAAAGILLADENGSLELVASTSEESHLVETIQLAAHVGPCIECYRTGKVVSLPDIAAGPAEWSRFRDGARQQGFASVFAIPMRLRDTTIGTLNLLRASVGELNPSDIRAAQALSDVATIGILHERTVRESAVAREQLQRALNSRIVIEQAKGVLMYTHSIGMDEAFTLMRGYARRNQQLLSNVAQQVVDRTLRL
jgi:GAF domain-containing protein